jgi:RNA polymerase sigma-70 factor (ECF subfamily)
MMPTGKRGLPAPDQPDAYLMTVSESGPNPDELIALAKRNSEGALGQLLELYRSYLALMARVQIGRRLQGKVDAADAVQETFLEAHRNFAQFRGQSEAEFVSWLRQILGARLSNLVRHYLGTKGRDIRLERAMVHEINQSSAIMNFQLVSAQESPSSHASRREHAVMLADALDRLPEDYREVIVLRHLESIAFAEIATRMGRSEDSVQKLWVRGLARLRQEMGATA